MKFTRIDAHPSLDPFIECYWTMQSDDCEPRMEKIIPDGFTELIFNYESPYRAKTKEAWNLLTPNLLAGQLTTYFYLENTGPTGSFAIKLKPAALTQFYDLNMGLYLDRIVDLDSFPDQRLATLKDQLYPFQNELHLKETLDNYFIELSQKAGRNPIKVPLELIFSANGIVTVAELCTVTGVGERQLERLFKRYVGLSPKYYSRIIRFNWIFQLIKLKKNSWTEIVYLSGYYDQSHFIRNFKSFTGEDPSAYFFEKDTMANFFLRK